MFVERHLFYFYLFYLYLFVFSFIYLNIYFFYKILILYFPRHTKQIKMVYRFQVNILFTTPKIIKQLIKIITPPLALFILLKDPLFKLKLLR